MKFNKNELIHEIEKYKLIVILRGLNLPDAILTVDALQKGGIKFVEVTFDQTKKTPDSETAKIINTLCNQFPTIHIGAGTVMSAKQVKIAKKAGAKYIISPDTNKSVIEKTLKYGLVSLPGAFTPTEVATAHRYGADFVKLFPNGEMKPSYLKSILAPLSCVKIIAVGGVTIDNAKDYISIGAKGVGLSALANKELIKNKEFDKITETAKMMTESLK